MIHQHMRLFPTHVFTFKVENHRNEEWFDYISANGQRSQYGVQTDSNLHEQELFSPLTLSIIETVTEINDTLGYDDDYQLDFTSMWGQVLAANQAFFPHTHANNFWSGSYYVATPGNDQANAIEFFDPRLQSYVLSPKKKTRTQDTMCQQLIQPPVGWGIIFPSWLQHWVPTVPEDGRCSISWNILMRGDYDTRESKQWARI